MDYMDFIKISRKFIFFIFVIMYININIYHYYKDIILYLIRLTDE